jgi:(1->4)-alpha-D-glucan 1-alpha-D-glucosylmutase
MNETSNAMQELTRFLGLAHTYTDIFGQRHEASLNAQVAVIQAMTGIQDIEEPAHVLQELLQQRAKQIIEPVHGVRPQEEVECCLILRPGYEGELVKWVLRLENGQDYEGTAQIFRKECPTRPCAKGFESYSCKIPPCAELGYHSLSLYLKGGEILSTTLIVAPSVCYLPASERRYWGLACQVYALKGLKNWGMGDLSDVEALLNSASHLGAGFLGLNPLCSLFYARPEHISPYSPSSRSFFHYLYLDVPLMPEFSECPAAQRLFESEAFQTRLRATRNCEFVDYLEVAKLKKQILELLYNHFVQHHLKDNTDMALAFRSFQQEKGERLHAFGVFEALNEYLLSLDSNNWGWPVWPKAFQDRKGSEVASFADAHRKRVEFFQYLQYHLHLQLSMLQRTAMGQGMSLGLYFDLPVGSDASGFDVWYDSQPFALNMSIGAPPDEFNPKGQNWGLPPMIPQRLRERRYEPFIEVLRANMRYASILRIDHVMSLMRLFWIPRGMEAEQGLYVHYPMKELMSIVALESHRNQCVVVGEDLGTVPDEFRLAMKQAGMLSYRIFYFERTDERFLRPEELPQQALATVTSHDLPTLRGYWQGRDIDLRTCLELFPSKELKDRQIALRKQARKELLDLLNLTNDAFTPELVQRLYCYLGQAKSMLLLVPLEDLMNQLDQVNLPGTVQEYPNWRRRLPYSIEELTRRLSTELSWLIRIRREQGLEG